MFTPHAFGKIIRIYFFTALFTGAIGPELYAQKNQEESFIGLDVIGETKGISLVDFNIFEDGNSPYWIEHQIPVFINQQETASFEFQVPGLRPAEIIEADLFYRTNGYMGFRQRKMQLINGLLSIELEPNLITGTQLQYFVRIRTSQYEEDIFYPSQGTGNVGYLSPISDGSFTYSSNSTSKQTNYQQTEDIDVRFCL